jgi:hypothetical protein
MIEAWHNRRAFVAWKSFYCYRNGVWTMKKLFLLALVPLLLAACGPSPQAVQTAIAQTQAFWILAPNETESPLSTPLPSNTPPSPSTSTTVVTHTTSTPIPSSTWTPITTPLLYILETGWCKLSIGEITGVDPKTNPLCELDARRPIYVGSNGYEGTLSYQNGKVQVYCALFSLDHTLIMVYMDKTGTGKVNCKP